MFTEPLTEISAGSRNQNISDSAQPASEAGKHRHLWADFLDNVASLISHNFIRIHGLLSG
jgi:hypothetical protein